MSDDLDLIERFEPLASAPFAPVTDPGVLRARATQRRRRRRMAVGAGALGAAVVLGALGAVAAQQGGPEPIDRLHTVSTTVPAPDPTTEPTVPASYGTGPRLVVGTVPPDMASHGCSLDVLVDGGQLILCMLGFPATPQADGINLAMRRTPVSKEVRQAWADHDAATAVGILQRPGDATFTEIGGRTVLAVGEVDRADGSSLGLPDLVTRSYEVLIGSYAVQVNAGGATAEQVDAVIRGLDTEPVDLGFSIPEGVLPEGADPIAQGQLRLWHEPDALDPTRSDDNGGSAAGITYDVPDLQAPVDVTVVRDVDAELYLEGMEAQQLERNGTAVEPVETHGRTGIRARIPYLGVGGEGTASNTRVAVAADDTTVVIADGATRLASALVDLAGQVEVAPTLPAAPDQETGSEAPPTGWYVPRGLPDGWVLDRGQAQAADGAGEAQLWFTSPSGNVVVVTMKLPRDGEWHDADARLHPLPGQAQPVYAQPVHANGPSYQSLVTMRPGAYLLVDLLGTPKGGEPSPAGLDETDELAAALAPATTGQWRSYLAAVPATPVLLEAPTLDDLPDES